MSGVLSAMVGAMPPQAKRPDVAGLLADRQLAAMFAVDVLRDNDAFGWQKDIGHTNLVSDDEQPDWFMGHSLLVEQVLREVRTQLPEPNTPDAAAELNALLSYSTISSMLSSKQGVSAVVQKICSMAQQIVDHAEEAAAQRQAAASGSSKAKKVAVAFTLAPVAGALGEADLTELERRMIEARLRELHEMKEDAVEKLKEFAFENDAWKITLGKDTSRYVMVPKTSIRVTDVVEVMVDGKRFFDVTLKGVPMIVDGKLVFGEVHGQRFAADSDVIKEHGSDAQGLAAAFKKLNLDTIKALMEAERQRLKQELERKAKPEVSAQISGCVDVAADALCSLSPNAAGMTTLPSIKKPTVAAAPALQ